MSKDYRILIQDMLFSIENIESFVKKISKAEFEENLMVQDAVIRRFAVIGEAANKMPHEVRDKYNTVHWREIVTMRNFLLHEYFNIDLSIVWDTIKLDLPKLRVELSKILKDADNK